MVDAHAMLGITRDANTEQIRLAYRRKARVVHPDSGGDPDLFVGLSQAYSEARSFRAATKGPTGPPPPTSNRRADLAEIAYRFELGRPGHSPWSFIQAVDVEINPGATTLSLAPDGLARVADLIDRATDVPVVVEAIIVELDIARR